MRSGAEGSRRHIVEMLDHMTRHPAKGGPEVMEMHRFWHPRMNWYGPAGIGTGRGIAGFRNWHQIPFLNGMLDRGQHAGDIIYHFFGDGDYAAVTGWPNMIQTVSHDGWMGIAPAGKRISMCSLDFWRIEDGLIRENWVLVDLLDAWRAARAWMSSRGSGSSTRRAFRGEVPFPVGDAMNTDCHGKRKRAGGRAMTVSKVTSAEVAERAGVSQSAVSRVFTPGASASAKTVEKVRRAAAELGYRPNILARAMVSGRSRMIGLVVAYLDNQFYPDVLERLSNALQQRGYHVLVFMAAQTAGNIDTVVEGDPGLPGGRHHRGLRRALFGPLRSVPRGGRAHGPVQPGAGW